MNGRHVLVAAALTFATASAAAAEAGPKSFDGKRAMADIAALLQFTPRAIDTPGHQQAIDFIEAQLSKTAFKDVSLQRWSFHDEQGRDHAMTNVIARFEPQNPRRIILATHYDSIVRAYADKEDPNGLMPGANNSASGVALLLEIARAISTGPAAPKAGIDMIFFDGEEGPKSLGAGDPQWKALGSPYFAAHLDEFYRSKKPQQGIVFDMVCYRDLKLNPEPASLFSAGANVTKFWKLGEKLAPKIFDPTPLREPIGDDQIALSKAGIPSFLVIDFAYDPWFNTTKDTIDKCSAGSLAALGKTVLAYVYGQ